MMQISSTEEKIIVLFSKMQFDEIKKLTLVCFELADELNHHPEISLNYSSLRIELTTHDIGNKVGPLDHEFVRLLKARTGL